MIMALSNNDLKEIKNIVGESVKVEIHREIGPFRLEVNQRFEVVKNKIDNNHKVVLQKIDEIRRMESEYIQAVSLDVETVKKKLQLKTSFFQK